MAAIPLGMQFRDVIGIAGKLLLLLGASSCKHFGSVPAMSAGHAVPRRHRHCRWVCSDCCQRENVDAAWLGSCVPAAAAAEP